MRRVLGGCAAALLALTAVPALADDLPTTLEPCSGVPAGDRLTLAGLTETVAAPALLGDTTRTYVLDLAGQPEGTTATVGSVLSWTLPANDYDLTVAGGDSEGTSQEFNVTQTAPSESAGTAAVGHCSPVTLTVSNFLAPVSVDTLTLKTTVTPEEPVEE